MNFQTALAWVKKNYAIAASAVVVVACIAVYLVRDEQITRLEADYDDLTIRRSRIIKNFRHAAELPSDLETVKQFANTVDSRLFNPEDLGGNKVYFYQREAATGVKLPNLAQYAKAETVDKKGGKARRKSSDSSYVEIGFEMNAAGTYEQVLNFMRELEGGPAFYRLDGFSVVPGNDGLVNARLTISILGKKR